MASYREQLGQAMEKILPAPFFSRIRRLLGVDWTAQRITWVAGLMVQDYGRMLTARFENVCRACPDMLPIGKFDASYGGFTEALRRGSPRVIPRIKDHLRRRMQQRFPQHWKRNGRLPPRRICDVLAVDGPRIETPRTIANEDGLGCAGREKTAPRVFLTVLWHVRHGAPGDQHGTALGRPTRD